VVIAGQLRQRRPRRRLAPMAVLNAAGAEQAGAPATSVVRAPGEAQNSTQPMRELKIQLHPLSWVL
jgi:hypothetical protein